MKDLLKAGFYENALVFLGLRHKYVCDGKSMNPTLKDGEVVLVDRDAEIEAGDIVVAKHPIEQTSEIIKRVERINEHGHYFLIGDNLEDSNDSRPIWSGYEKIYQRKSRRPFELTKQINVRTIFLFDFTKARLRDFSQAVQTIARRLSAQFAL